MFSVLRARLRQKYRTMAYPAAPAAALSDRFAGRPAIQAAAEELGEGLAHCPTGALHLAEGQGRIDLGKCLFCRACERACAPGRVHFSGDHRMAAARRADLVVGRGAAGPAPARNELASRLFRRSLKLRQVSAGGCNACEADCNVLTTLAWDIGRFGIQFVASPRHADGLLITGPVTRNMELAVRKTYQAVPSPKIVIAAGACAISGGPYLGHPEQCDGAAGIVPVDLFIPGCPPHPLTILDGLLRFLGRLGEGDLISQESL